MKVMLSGSKYSKLQDLFVPMYKEYICGPRRVREAPPGKLKLVKVAKNRPRIPPPQLAKLSMEII